MNTPLKKGWKLVKLGDIATEYIVRGNSANSGYDKFVGSNHIGRFDLRVMYWGDSDEVSSEMKVFQPGDYLFVRRSLYASDFRERAARADFSGLCSGDILTIREKEGVIADGFLAAVLNHPKIWEYVVATATGSITRRIKWKQLAEYEFPLPPVDEQRRIADLLWAADDSITEYQNTLDKLQITATSFLETQIADGVKNNWKPTLFDELLTETQYGISKKSGLQRDGTVPILGIPNVIAGDIDLSKLSWVEAVESEFEKYKLKTDDILIVRTNGNPNYVGRCVALKNIPENSVYASYLIRLRVLEDRANPSFIEAVLNSNYMRRTLMNEIRSSAGNYNLNTQGIRKQKIPLPSLAVQESIMKTLNEFNSSKKALEGHIENSKKLKSNLLNKLLSN